MAATLRDQLLPLANTLRNIPNVFGMRRYSATIRRRAWSGQQQGQGTATDFNIAIIPPPRVVEISEQLAKNSLTEIETSGMGNGMVIGKIYKLDQITPAFSQSTTVNGITTTTKGGLSAEQIRLWPYRDQGFVENLVSLVGDDGYLRECIQLNVEQYDPFNYSMLVKEISRPRTILMSSAITAASLTVVHGNTQQLVCTGTFNGGATSILTTLATWSSSATSVATVDIYGNVTGLTAGTTTIMGVVLGTTSTAVMTVT